MKQNMGRILLLAMSVVYFVPFLSTSQAEMTIYLKNGRTMSVPITQEEFVGLSFEKEKTQTSGITWDFETGDLRGWTKTGTAFDTQPTYGDNPTARHRGQPSRHQGNYWIGGYENRHRPTDTPGRVQGDGPQGTLTSQPFTITSNTISFLIGGGCDINTVRVELLIDGQPVMKATGKCTETMERVTWNVVPFKGGSAQIRLIDASSGGWGHINFDDVRFE